MAETINLTLYISRLDNPFGIFNDDIVRATQHINNHILKVLLK